MAGLCGELSLHDDETFPRVWYEDYTSFGPAVGASSDARSLDVAFTDFDRVVLACRCPATRTTWRMSPCRGSSSWR